MDHYGTTIHTSFGAYRAVVSPSGVATLRFLGKAKAVKPSHPTDWPPSDLRKAETIAKQLAYELTLYHAGKITRFKTPLDWNGQTTFRQRVWTTLRQISYGTTRTYGEIAASVGCHSPRAIGQACAANPVLVLTPCHRVVGATGIGGWSGLPGIKESLLALENRARD